MLYFYTGTPGSGKTAHATSEILKALKNNMIVICNYPINYKQAKKCGVKNEQLKNFIYMKNKQLNISSLMEIWRKEIYEKINIFDKEGNKKLPLTSKILLVIDEAGTFLNTRMKKEEIENWSLFTSLHRHFNYRIIMISQSSKMVHSDILAQSEYDFQHTDLAERYLLFAIIKFLFHIRFFKVYEIWRPKKQILNANIKKLNIKEAKCYDTMYMCDSIQDIYNKLVKKEEQKKEQQKNLFLKRLKEERELKESNDKVEEICKQQNFN